MENTNINATERFKALAGDPQSPARIAIRPLAAVGRTTLTLYILQSLVFVPVFYGFGLGLYGDWNQLTRLWVGIGAIAAQLGLTADNVGVVAFRAAQKLKAEMEKGR